MVTEMATTRGQVLHPSCWSRFGLSKDLSVATEYFCVATDFGQD